MSISHRPAGSISPLFPQGSKDPRNCVAQSAERMWIDLPSANRRTLGAAWERYDLPPETMTYFLLRYQSAQVIHPGSALFLVTFVTVLSRQYLFTTRELKLCVTPTRILTLCGPSGRAQSNLTRLLPGLRGLGALGTGPFLCGLLAGVAGSYEPIAKAVEDTRVDDAPREARLRWHKRVAKFIRFLRDEQAFLGNVTREARKLFAAAESQHLFHLEERTGVLARVVWNAARGKGKATAPLENTWAVNGG